MGLENGENTLIAVKDGRKQSEVVGNGCSVIETRSGDRKRVKTSPTGRRWLKTSYRNVVGLKMSPGG